jgi:asparagine synthase (glutamine-hydrolysing)
MCGLIAILGQGVQQAVLERALQAMRHRGPDGQRSWIAPDGRVGLGHARLSLVDLSGGAHPLTNEDGSLHAIVNGEFYGFQEIREDLRRRGHELRTTSDSEILLHLYEDEGSGCLKRLRGEFAFVLWDARRRCLFAARDRFGIKPLFYSQHGEALFLASEAKALFAAGVPPRWDVGSVLHHLLFCMPLDRSLFEGIRQLPPGHFLLASEGELQITPYWDPGFPRPAEDARGPAPGTHAIEEVHEQLRDAVGLRLQADVPVGFLLSGGLDSSAVLGVGSSLGQEGAEAFTVSFDHPKYDELPIARETAEARGVRLHVVRCGADALASHFEESVVHGELLAMNGHTAAKYLLSKAVRDAGFKAVLSGDGGDELFAGYDFCGADMRPQQQAAPEEGPLKEVARQLGFVPALMQSLWKSRSRFLPLIDQDVVRAFLEENPYASFIGQLAPARLAGRARVHQGLYIWIKSHLVNYILASERLEMAHSVEVRMPLLDHELFETARRLPVELLSRAVKHPLREAARPYLTETVLNQLKRPFVAPPSRAAGAEAFRDFILDSLSGPMLRTLPWLDARAIEQRLRTSSTATDQDRFALDVLLLPIVSICCLQRRYKLGTSP